MNTTDTRPLPPYMLRDPRNGELVVFPDTDCPSCGRPAQRVQFRDAGFQPSVRFTCTARHSDGHPSFEWEQPIGFMQPNWTANAGG